MLGILGGMGPLAGADVFTKVTLLTPAFRDQDHFQIILYSDPSIPDRTVAIADPSQASPLPKLLQGVKFLHSAGATLIAIACNTAHHWHAALENAVPVPIVHIANAVRDEVSAVRKSEIQLVGLLCTEGTRRSGFYDKALTEVGIAAKYMSADETSNLLNPAIAWVKQGVPQRGRDQLLKAVDLMRARGATQVVLACTELSIAMGDMPADVIDANSALARSCVKLLLRQRTDEG